ncbi:hypothetical protein PL75_04190 [Neisseria arctica]|uniref:Uncharacterized protein n=1 Tax=Neisseria arctica TaxID=1470200 RepID=A0A0J0YSM4_9NEIS|nr:hypothetical protein [Neisseria arctica]KLT73116.1 hypothetical protein PL75_04190 [Neisseria arctica]UOO87157.1 hypothetical protein LVJ86_02585 [Neisseria arctica]
MKINTNFDRSFLDALLYLKDNIENNFDANIISYISMKILNKYSSNFNEESRDIIMNLIAMDMGEEFKLSKDECLNLTKNLFDIVNKDD